MNDVISTSHLTKTYGNTLAVDKVDLAVKQGEIFGFLGLNGAGKTTTIRMLLGMITPTAGQCFILGKRVSPGDVTNWNNVGYMVETPYSYPELTVKENLEIVGRLRGIKDKKSVALVMEKLKLDIYQNKKAKHLSLGNAQRLGIAKALLHNPKILILDEPTNGLDPAGIVEIRELLQDLARNAGVTILVSSHNLDEISRIATKIAIIHSGRLIKEMDAAHLDSQLKKTLLLDGKDRQALAAAVSDAGYRILGQDQHKQDLIGLQLDNEYAVNNPEKIAALLVNAGCPPTLLKVEKEDLESYFLRTIREVGLNNE